VLEKDHAVAVSRHDATPLTSDEPVHHLRGRNPARPAPVAADVDYSTQYVRVSRTWMTSLTACSIAASGGMPCGR
ncbi:hypothetical protein, partial [Pseudonocardia alni]|uniref:hypothetical protein n=1 Tax=Pseudonocardia alni TaxID=33907 RepID=UPI0033E18EC9